MSKLPRPSTSKVGRHGNNSRPSTVGRQSTIGRPSVSRPSVSRPSVSRPSVARPSVARPSTIGSKTQIDVKSNVSNNIKVILEYLIENEYPSVLTKKNLMNPTEATFKAIFKFIIQDFYPDFDCKNLGHEVINQLNVFDYPYPLKESHFTPIGSPHSWPHLLEALAFTCNSARLMAYERRNISQLYVLNAKDEDDAEEELRHHALMTKCYREYQNESGDPNIYNERYFEELDIEGQKAVMEREISRITEGIKTLQENNAKFPDIEAEYNEKLDKLKEENAVLERDMKDFPEAIKQKRQDLENSQNDLEEKKMKSSEFKDEAVRCKKDIITLEDIVAKQPPQHEVQARKQCLNDLVDKTRNLKEETKITNEEIAVKQVHISNQQRNLKEKKRKMLEEVKRIYDDEIEFDLDKAIDNKSIMQATAMVEKLKPRIAADKEESRNLSDKLYDLEIMKRSLDDDLRLSKNALIQAKEIHSQKEYEYKNERNRLIAESESLSEKVKDARATIEDLRKQLAECEPEDVISAKIAVGKQSLVGIHDEIKLLQKIRSVRSNELIFIEKETSNKLQVLQMLISEVSDDKL